jgi:predicted small secreted protein
MLRKSLTIALIAGAIASIVACNTVRGAGQDIQSASNTVDNAMH